jgi:hypothetical protein
MKGIAISTVALFIIAIFTVTLLIIFIGSNISPALKNAYCSLVIALRGFLPLPESLRPGLPAYCKKEVYPNTYYIESNEPDRIAYEIASHILACWTITGKVELKANRTCSEVVVKRIEGIVDSNLVKSKLPENYQDIFEWRSSVIDRPMSLGIFYEYPSKKVIIV